MSKYVPSTKEVDEKKDTTSKYTQITISYEAIDEILIKKSYKKIGENVKRLRESKGYSQLSLAQSIGHKSVSVVSCAEICHKNYHFNIEHLIKIASVLDVKICDFFEGVDSMVESVKIYKLNNEDQSSMKD